MSDAPVSADLFARAFALPAVRAAVVPQLESLLRPSIDWVRGEQRDITDRVTDLEAATAAEAWQ